MIEVLEASFLHTAFDVLFKGHQDLHSRVRVEFTKSAHVIYARVAEKTEVDGALRNSLTIGRELGDVSRASTGVCISPVNLIVTN